MRTFVESRVFTARLHDHLDDEAYAATSRLVRATAGILEDALAPQGINIGVNQGEAAGAGIAAHLHYHLIPRWIGDTSFVTVVGDVRVISQSLEETWRDLRPWFERLEGDF